MVDERKGEIKIRDTSNVIRWCRKSKIETVLILVIALATPGRSFGLGLGVEPGEIYLQNVPLGKEVAVSKLGGERMKLEIQNKGETACTYGIDILRTAQTTAALREGYIDIPDTSWIWPENKEVRVEANSSKVVELYLKIPKKAKYANKKYQAVIEVKSKKNRPEEIFVLACQLKMSFSTLNLDVKEAKNAQK